MQSIFLTAYGMKPDNAEQEFLNSIRPPANSTSRFVGVNVDTDYILLFTVSAGYEGKVYSMLLADSGSVCMKFETKCFNCEVELNCYPPVFYILKASGLTMNILSTNKGMGSKPKTIRSIIDDVTAQSRPPICGYRFEFC